MFGTELPDVGVVQLLENVAVLHTHSHLFDIIKNLLFRFLVNVSKKIVGFGQIDYMYPFSLPVSMLQKYEIVYKLGNFFLFSTNYQNHGVGAAYPSTPVCYELLLQICCDFYTISHFCFIKALTTKFLLICLAIKQHLSFAKTWLFCIFVAIIKQKK